MTSLRRYIQASRGPRYAGCSSSSSSKNVSTAEIVESNVQDLDKEVKEYSPSALILGSTKTEEVKLKCLLGNEHILGEVAKAFDTGSTKVFLCQRHQNGESH